MTDQHDPETTTEKRAAFRARTAADRKIIEARTAKDAAVQAVIDGSRNEIGPFYVYDLAGILSDADQALTDAIKAREELS